jgi:hypothetical protein
LIGIGVITLGTWAALTMVDDSLATTIGVALAADFAYGLCALGGVITILGKYYFVFVLYYV